MYDGGCMSILEVHDVSIRYMTGDFKDIGLKEYLVRHLQNNYHVHEFWADRNISFSLEKGDMLGIIGANGAGKSTLLKTISGIMEPTEGYVKRNGTIAALLELASGFDGDLTVRENAYLRGAMLGYTRQFMEETYDQIIDFAELKDFQDRPFKQLSSGMKSRLAFSIASLVQPDILILDEVLSVGDGAFRKKSEAKMREIIGGGATTILVSHSLEQVRTMCTKVLWLNKGEQMAFGNDVQEICDRYQAFLEGKTTCQCKKPLAQKVESVGGESLEVVDVEKKSSSIEEKSKNFFAVCHAGNLHLRIISALILVIVGWALLYMHSKLLLIWGGCSLWFCADCWTKRRELGSQIRGLFSSAAKKNLIYSCSFVFLFAFIAHGFLFTNEFFSHDSVQQTFYQNSPGWFQFCLSVGRFIIPLYEMMKGPYSAPWLIGLFFIVWMGLSSFLIIELFHFKGRSMIAMVSGLLCTNTALMLTGATYIYCMDEYTAALLFSTAAAYCFCKVPRGKVLGVVFLIFSMGIYQAYFTVTLALCFIFAVQRLTGNVQVRNVIWDGLKQIGLLVLSFGIYFAIWTALCSGFHVVKLRSTEESILSKTLTEVVSIITGSYCGYFKMFLDPRGLLGYAYVAFNIFLFALFVVIFYRFLRKKSINYSNKYLATVLLLCAPLVFNSSKIILAGNASDLTGYVYELVYIFFLMWLSQDEHGEKERLQTETIGFVASVLIVCVIYNNVLLANQAYMKKDLEKTATISLVTRIIDHVETLEGYTPNETLVYVVGDLRFSDLNKGNQDVQYLETKTGLWYNYSATYNLVRYITDYMNYPIHISVKQELAASDEVQGMPAFPASGSIKMIDGAAVIKLS